jgi:hypothetical protein
MITGSLAFTYSPWQIIHHPAGRTELGGAAAGLIE